MNSIALATLSLTGLGLVSAAVLTVASKIFYVWEDPKIENVESALLGANCGGCGYAGCAAAAVAVVKGDAEASVCVAGTFEITKAVAKVMGQEVKEQEPEISLPGCRYSNKDADLKFIYNGFNDCRAAMMLYDGAKECKIGCLGLGTCDFACPFDAITMVDSLPVVDADKCTGCGVCEEVCPKNIIRLSNTTTRMTSEYTDDECTAPCQRTCPTGIDIPSYIKAISKGDYEGAITIMREKDPLLLVCGNICPSPCEFECRRNLVDQPVQINKLKKFAVTYEMDKGIRVESFKNKKTNKKVAIIGGGAQGLTASYFLARLGHSPKIFDAAKKLGGILRYVISKDRLPENVLDWEIDTVLKMGVEAETEKLMGKDISVESLLNDGFDSILFTVGGMDSRKIIRGKDSREQSIPGVMLMVDYLNAVANSTNLNVGSKVCIVGAGDKAIELITKSLNKSGVENIKILAEDEIATKLIGSKNKLVGVEIEKDGAKTIEDADTVIVASGRLAELLVVAVKKDGKITGWETAEITKAIDSKRNNGVFTSVEMARVNDNIAVVKAVASGRKMAAIIHGILDGTETVAVFNPAKQSKTLQNVTEITDLETFPSILPIDTSNANKTGMNIKPIDLGFTKELAEKEASRCLDCGLLCYTRVKCKS